jgi:hypothetical protein
MSDIEYDSEWDDYVEMIWDKLKDNDPDTPYSQALRVARENAARLDAYASFTSENGDSFSDSEYQPNSDESQSEDESFSANSSDIISSFEEPVADGHRYGLSSESSDSSYYE